MVGAWAATPLAIRLARRAMEKLVDNIGVKIAEYGVAESVVELEQYASWERTVEKGLDTFEINRATHSLFHPANLCLAACCQGHLDERLRSAVSARRPSAARHQRRSSQQSFGERFSTTWHSLHGRVSLLMIPPRGAVSASQRLPRNPSQFVWGQTGGDELVSSIRLRRVSRQGFLVDLASLCTAIVRCRHHAVV